MTGTPRPSGQDAGFGMLVRTMPVRLVDVSRDGCRVESDRRLAPGTNGQLHLEMDGRLHFDDVRVSRCQLRAGAGRAFDVGVEILKTRRLSRRSLRLALRRVIGERPETFTAARDERLPPDDVSLSRKEKEVGRAPPVAVTTDTS
jgi:hypothetical protein